MLHFGPNSRFICWTTAFDYGGGGFDFRKITTYRLYSAVHCALLRQVIAAEYHSLPFSPKLG